ncbi:MAG: hypothetical protein QM520_03815 [Gammaproteobacteria bacterium]|nr:hypothetical protein [Gammaproteobacteria bacterium]
MPHIDTRITFFYGIIRVNADSLARRAIKLIRVNSRWAYFG